MKKVLSIIFVFILLNGIFIGLVNNTEWLRNEKHHQESRIIKDCDHKGIISGKRGNIIVDASGGQDHVTIQDAINASNPGDTIYVFAGNYSENVIINRTVTIIGNGSANTTIDGDGNGDVVRITSAWVNITGFNVTNSGSSGNDAGIDVQNDYYRIYNNICYKNKYGIYCNSVINGSIDNNTVGTNFFGIYLHSSENNTLINNTLNLNNYAVYIDSSNYNTMTNNTFNSNNSDGILLFDSMGNSFSYNHMFENGIFLSGSSPLHWNTHSINTSNTVNGNPVYYWVNVSGGNIPPGGGQIILVNCTDVKIEGQNVSDGSVGVLLGFSENNTVANITSSANSNYGVYLYYSNNNTLSNISCNSNYYGIYSHFSNNSNISDSICNYNYRGFYVTTSNDNILINNTANSNNDTGFRFSSSINDTFINNTANLNTNGIYLESNGYNFLLNNTASSNSDYGIYFHSSNCYNNIAGNNASNNTNGIYLSSSCNNNDIGYNDLTSNTNGIYIFSSTNNNIDNNTASSNSFGIYLSSSGGNNVTNNTANSNTFDGIYVSSSSSNILMNNLLSSNDNGIYLSTSNNNIIFNNTVNSNSFGIYLTSSSNSNNLTNNTASSNSNTGIRLASSDQNIIIGNTANSNTNYGFQLTSSNSNDLMNNTGNSNNLGIYFSSSDNNNISNSTCNNNTDGIFFSSSLSNNITNNTCDNNTRGMYLLSSDNNTIDLNVFSNNTDVGIKIANAASDNNTIHHNWFSDNNGGGVQAFDDGKDNLWDDNISEGNYWSDYSSRYPSASDNGTVWNISYQIDGNEGSVDRYPLVDPAGGHDDITPSIDADNSPNEGITGENFDFNISASDNSEVDTVYVNWSHGNFKDNISLTETNNFWLGTISLDNDTGQLNYTIYVNDTSNNYNISDVQTVNVTDNEAPDFTDNSPNNGYTGKKFELNISASDNIEVHKVFVNWGHGSLSGNISLSLTDAYWLATIILDDNVSDLSYIIYINDTSNNYNISAIQNVNVTDNELPYFTDNSSDNGFTGNNFIFNISAYDNLEVDTVHVNWSHGSLSGNNSLSLSGAFWLATITLDNNLSDLSYVIHINDTSNNYNSSAVQTVSVSDNDAPVIGTDNSANTGTTGDNFEFNVSASDNIELDTIYVNWTHGILSGNKSLALAGGFWIGTIKLDDDLGELSYIIYFNDTSNNYNYSVAQSVSVSDNDAPALVSENSANTGTTGDDFVFNVSASDNIDVDSIYVNWRHDTLTGNVSLIRIGNYWTSSIMLDQSLNDLNYTIYVNDASDNYAISSLRSVDITDNDRPTYIDNTQTTGTTGDIFQFNVSAVDNIDVFSVFADWGHGELMDNISLNKIGNYWWANITVDHDLSNLTYRIIVCDSSDNYIMSSIKSINIGDNDKPTVIATSNKTIPQHTTIIFNGSQSSDNIGILNWTWTFLDKSNITLYGVTVNFTFHTAGSFEITLTVSDGANNLASGVIYVNVTDSDVPVANAGLDVTADQNTEILFDGSGSTDNIGIINFSWIFLYDGSEVILNGSTPRYTFSIPGNYIINLTVIDLMGNTGTDTFVVTVIAVEDSDTTPIGEITVEEGDVRFLNYTDDQTGTSIEISVSGNGTLVAARVNDPPVYVDGEPAGYIHIGFYVMLDFTGDLKWTNITISYADVKTNETVNYASATIFYFDGGEWKKADNTGIDEENRIVWANVSHFTIFSAFALPSEEVGDDDDGGDGVGGEKAEEAWYKSGTGIIIIVIVILLVIVMIGVFFYARKRKEQEEEDEEGIMDDEIAEEDSIDMDDETGEEDEEEIIDDEIAKKDSIDSDDETGEEDEEEIIDDEIAEKDSIDLDDETGEEDGKEIMDDEIEEEDSIDMVDETGEEDEEGIMDDEIAEVDSIDMEEEEEEEDEKEIMDDKLVEVDSIDMEEEEDEEFLDEETESEDRIIDDEEAGGESNGMEEEIADKDIEGDDEIVDEVWAEDEENQMQEEIVDEVWAEDEENQMQEEIVDEVWAEDKENEIDEEMAEDERVEEEEFDVI